MLGGGGWLRVGIAGSVARPIIGILAEKKAVRLISQGANLFTRNIQDPRGLHKTEIVLGNCG